MRDFISVPEDSDDIHLYNETSTPVKRGYFIRFTDLFGETIEDVVRAKDCFDAKFETMLKHKIPIENIEYVS